MGRGDRVSLLLRTSGAAIKFRVVLVDKTSKAVAILEDWQKLSKETGTAVLNLEVAAATIRPAAGTVALAGIEIECDAGSSLWSWGSGSAQEARVTVALSHFAGSGGSRRRAGSAEAGKADNAKAAAKTTASAGTAAAGEVFSLAKQFIPATLQRLKMGDTL